MTARVMRHIEIMKRMDGNGWGVMMKGAPYVCPLPAGYDGGRCEVAVNDSRILIKHPGKPMLSCDPYTGKTRAFDA